MRAGCRKRTACSSTAPPRQHCCWDQSRGRGSSSAGEGRMSVALSVAPRAWLHATSDNFSWVPNTHASLKFRRRGVFHAAAPVPVPQAAQLPPLPHPLERPPLCAHPPAQPGPVPRAAARGELHAVHDLRAAPPAQRAQRGAPRGGPGGLHQLRRPAGRAWQLPAGWRGARGGHIAVLAMSGVGCRHGC